MTDQRDEQGSDPSLLEQTLHEHEGCMQLLTDLEACLDRRPYDAKRWPTELKEKLVRLSTALREHFECEESGALFRRIPERHPALAAPLAQLEAEHPKMLEALDTLLRKAEMLDEPEMVDLRELSAHVQLFAARFRRHEAAENEVVIEAYWNDVGVGD